ncbi:hypothetical protein C0Q70_09871 [Pomacea canaliculata]|uniref:Uncharacterized protein n=2 Tax=Pomacea canaliculata TaxID=400727 RepID=A0A2T7PB09_POMCA|nr:hypothetical protein C0Q70_09871 [Pomacea canaliculata]
MTDAQLEREFWTESLQPVAGKESGHHSDNSQSADRPKSSDSKTSSGQSDQSTEDEHGPEGSPDSKSKTSKKRHQQSLWKSLRKIGGDLNEDTRRMFHNLRGRLQRGSEPRQTKVKAVHILPWRRRRQHMGASSGERERHQSFQQRLRRPVV